ncbi:MAG TPA: protein-glutamate O-methyltransferase CheR [Steroidobacteraceae bacterium]|nr:protein-glutamate O-methyltransferase CheR [Steroidobacteraceae bacterium]
MLRIETQGLQRLREFPFGNEDFAALRGLVKSLTGINLSEQKRELVYGRLSRRLRALKLKSFREYRELLASDPQELVHLSNAITTNLTSFFRERHHFEYLRDELLRPLAADARAKRRVRIWSAGCSTGEEPYSIAMSVIEALPDLTRWDVRVLATDLDSDALERARAGTYPAERVRSVGPARLARFFTQCEEGSDLAYRVIPEVAALVTFKQLNLMDAWPMKGPLDVIFCRNTVIYFDKETQRDLFARMGGLQRPGDKLFLGHSESLFQVSTLYGLVGRTIYRRT